MPREVMDSSSSPMEPGCERLPTKEEFDHLCKWKVARIVDTLSASIFKYEAFNALASGQEMPGWVKDILLDVVRPPSHPLAPRRDDTSHGGTRSRRGRRS